MATPSVGARRAMSATSGRSASAAFDQNASSRGWSWAIRFRSAIGRTSASPIRGFFGPRTSSTSGASALSVPGSSGSSRRARTFARTVAPSTLWRCSGAPFSSAARRARRMLSRRPFHVPQEGRWRPATARKSSLWAIPSRSQSASARSASSRSTASSSASARRAKGSGASVSCWRLARRAVVEATGHGRFSPLVVSCANEEGSVTRLRALDARLGARDIAESAQAGSHSGHVRRAREAALGVWGTSTRRIAAF